MTLRPYLGELIGTFVLVFGGCGSAVLAGGHIGFAGVAAAFGLSLPAMVYTWARSRAATSVRPSR